MEGGIYTREKCSQCNRTLVYCGSKGITCPDHPGERARTCIVKFPGKIYKTFTDIRAAEQLLNFLRYEKGERKEHFNPDDYRSARPNSFGALIDQYLARKKTRKTFKKIERYISRALESFGLGRNVRDVTSTEIEDYLYGIPGISEKTRADHCSQLHDFWTWCRKRKIISLAEFPEFPEIEYKLGYRKVTTWEIQEKVIDRVKEISYERNPKIWLGIEMLATHTEIRPGDLLKIREGDYQRGYVTIFDPTKSQAKGGIWKTIRLLPEHTEAWENIRGMYPCLNDEMPFFRHHGGIAGLAVNQPFSDKYFYTWWMKACDEIGLKGVPLYPGTKHTTATETARLLGPKKAQQASGLTNKAFERYNQAITDGAYDVVTQIGKARKRGRLVPFKRNKREGE